MTHDAPWRIVPLADVPAAIPVLAEWFHEEWSVYDERSPQEIAAQLSQNLHRDRLPITFLAVRGSEVLGTVSLDESDLPTHDHFSPWLASLYVLPSARGHGLGAALVTHAIAFARTHGILQIHLWTPGPTALYEKHGWRLTEHTTYGGQAIQVMLKSIPPLS